MTEIEDQKSLLLMEFIDCYINGASEEQMADLIKRAEDVLKAENWQWLNMPGYGSGV